jgi:AcrR family transcriptional regulator
VPRDGSDTKQALILAGERLLATKGLDAVAVSEIIAEAGARNASALQYHFGSRDGLMTAILERHKAGVAGERQRLLDAAGDDADLRDLLRVLITPLAAKLDDDDGGPYYLLLLAQLHETGRVFSPPASDALTSPDLAKVVERISKAVGPLPPRVLVIRLDLVMTLLIHALAGRARAVLGGTRSKTAYFVEDLVDASAGILTTSARSGSNG